MQDPWLQNIVLTLQHLWSATQLKGTISNVLLELIRRFKTPNKWRYVLTQVTIPCEYFLVLWEVARTHQEDNHNTCGCEFRPKHRTQTECTIGGNLQSKSNLILSQSVSYVNLKLMKCNGSIKAQDPLAQRFLDSNHERHAKTLGWRDYRYKMLQLKVGGFPVNSVKNNHKAWNCSQLGLNVSPRCFNSAKDTERQMFLPGVQTNCSQPVTFPCEFNPHLLHWIN